jgi:hypothetical protein
MDLTFNCPNCKQEMVADTAGAGSQVNCPACNALITIPEPEVTNVQTLNPINSSAAAKEHKHYAVPQHEGPAEVLIQKPNLPLETAAKKSDKIMRIRTIRRSDCMEVGHDRFDDRVTEFISRIGEENVVSINTIAYTHQDIATKQLLTDYGIMVVFKG